MSEQRVVLAKLAAGVAALADLACHCHGVAVTGMSFDSAGPKVHLRVQVADGKSAALLAQRLSLSMLAVDAEGVVRSRGTFRSMPLTLTGALSVEELAAASIPADDDRANTDAHDQDVDQALLDEAEREVNR